MMPAAPAPVGPLFFRYPPGEFNRHAPALNAAGVVRGCQPLIAHHHGLALIDERAFLLLPLALQAQRVLPGHRLQHADRAAVFVRLFNGNQPPAVNASGFKTVGFQFFQLGGYGVVLADQDKGQSAQRASYISDRLMLPKCRLS